MNKGDQVPDFEAVDQSGERVTLAGLLESGPLVLFFYPQADTPGCTAESCHFRDLAAEFAEVGASRVGISADDVERQKSFDEKHSLGFPLLSDPDKKIATLFGVKRFAFLPNKRSTFVIDRDGRVLEVVSSELNMGVHADRALEALRGASS